ncbi:hypothetical protein IQ264_17595 [Phormidium sp. LEGE 05292]|uniref:hypothetical protein n=1 Tax=[Phormidium] sp. LEGE 05292 TaxID=767427 RepID=UPI001882B785|nr:hypothetical protein [Phormidium sp. LEGE 05292]MBE9227243.1 hypothetical protein [Phormidium sp. LEGE 05292]
MRFRSMSVLIGIAALSTGILPVTIISATPKPHSAILAQSVPVGNVGKINPAQPIKMTVVNSTSIPLFAGISGGTRVELAPQNKNTFIFDSTPINVFVYPAEGSASLKYKTTTEGNTVNIQVTQVGGVTPGDGAINIRPSGAIYVF